jgi:hypothetical protein
MQIVKGNVGDAQKGAITDAIQKCMSLLSIGSDAYKGLLKNVYLQGTQRTQPPPPQPKTKPASTNSQPAEPPANQSDSSATLPKIAGVSFENRQGVIIAIGDHLFDKKELLKAAGFQWDKTGKTWMKQAA